MLMPLAGLAEKWDLHINGVLHCGAHLAEEAPQYHALRGSRLEGDVWWVEANPAVKPAIKRVLQHYPDQHLLEGLLWSEPGLTKTFHVTNLDGMSSSVLDFGSHTSFSPEIVFEKHLELETTTIDTLVEEHGIKANMLSMDLQGVEGEVLKGATLFLQNVDYIITEVNSAEVYKGCTQVEELDSMLVDFERVETSWVPGQHWGDSLYLKVKR